MENEEPFAKQSVQNASTSRKDDPLTLQVLCFRSSAATSVLSLIFSSACSKIRTFLSPSREWGLLFTRKYVTDIRTSSSFFLVFVFVDMSHDFLSLVPTHRFCGLL